MKADRQGFTLIELMIVVAIIAIIAAVYIPSIINARKSAWEAEVIATERSLVPAQELYRRRFGRYADVPQDLGTSGIMPHFATGIDFVPQYEPPATGRTRIPGSFRWIPSSQGAGEIAIFTSTSPAPFARVSPAL